MKIYKKAINLIVHIFMLLPVKLRKNKQFKHDKKNGTSCGSFREEKWTEDFVTHETTLTSALSHSLTCFRTALGLLNPKCILWDNLPFNICGIFINQ